MQRARGRAGDEEEELTGAGQHRAMPGTLRSVGMNAGSRGARCQVLRWEWEAA